MNNLKLILRGLLPFVGVALLSSCGEKSGSVETKLESNIASAEEETRPKLEEVIRGVWLAQSPEEVSAGVEKIQLDFRGDGEVTMIVFTPGEVITDGAYEVSGDDLKIQFDKSEPVETSYDGKVLTVTDKNTDQSVRFEKW